MATRLTLNITGMECPNCAMTLERMEDTLPGVLRAEASYRKAQLVVEYDPQKIDEARIRAEVERLGYRAV